MLIKYCFLLVSCILLSGIVQSQAERARYDNYRVYKVIAATETELQVLKTLEATSDSIIFVEGVHLAGRAVEVVVAPHRLPDFLTILDNYEMAYELLEANLEQFFSMAPKQVSARNALYDWNNYQQLDTTYTWLQGLAKDYPGVVTLIEGGKTYQSRSILGVKIDWSKGAVNKPGIFLEAGIHAREWISPATSTYIINELLTSTAASVRDVAQNYVWYIFPHANPDGYVYTHTTDRMWRKTRTPYGSCFGADPNRNWGFYWNTVGASSNPCSDTYAGPKAFSDIETRSLSNYIASLKGKIQLYISFHSYSQYLLYPYGHTPELPDNIEDFRSVFNVSVAAMGKQYGTKYTGGNVYDAIYPASGSSVDWAYGVQNVRMAFTYELRPSSGSVLTGFRLPANQIIPTGRETLDSVVAMVGEVKRLGYFKL